MADDLCNERAGPKPSTKSIYRPDIDGMRTIAILSVMIYHLNNLWLPGGFIGVDIFFVISGFVVTSSLNFSKSDTFFSFIAEFYARRLARILPALVFVLIVSVIAASLFIPPAWLSAHSDLTALMAFFGLSNWVMQNNQDAYFAPRAEFNPYTHTWSLGVEEQFYVIAPLIVYFCLRFARSNNSKDERMVVSTLMVITIVSLTACFLASKNNPTAAFYFIGCRFWELSLGVLLFLATYQSANSKTKPALTKIVYQHVSAWFGLGLNVIALFFANASNFPWPWAVLPAVGTVLMIGSAGTLPHNSIVRRTLSLSPMVWIGKRSYSLYLWHWPVYVLMRWTVGLNTLHLFFIAVLASFTLALFSYNFIEQPLRHNPLIEQKPKWLRITSFLLLTIAGYYSVGFLINKKRLYSLSIVTRNRIDWYAQNRMPYPNVGERNCDVDIQHYNVGTGRETRFVPKECKIILPNKRMYVLGDSHAGALSPMFEQICAEQGITVSRYSFTGCSYLDFKEPMNSSRRPPGCLEFSKTIKDLTLATSKSGDIVLLPSLRMTRYADNWERFDEKDMRELMYNPEALKSREEAITDSKQWLEPFSEKRLQVVFVAPTPLFKAPPYRCSDWFNRNNPVCIGQNQQSRAELEQLRGPIVSTMNVLAQTFSNIQVWDPFPLLCPDDLCKVYKDGHPLFFDGDHISGYANLLLYPDFKRAIGLAFSQANQP